MSDGRSAVREHGELARRFLKPREFECGISGSLFARIGFERVGVAGLERVADDLAATRIVNDDEPPWLTQSHGRRQTSDLKQSLQRPGRQWIGTKTPDIASPDQKIAQACTECFVEWRKLIHCRVPDVASAVSKMMISMICSSAPSTSPVWPPICRMQSHAMKSPAHVATTRPIIVGASPSAVASVKTPSRTATVVDRRAGCPAWAERPSRRAGGTKCINTGSAARADTIDAM